jgi:hypothetical protein
MTEKKNDLSPEFIRSLQSAMEDPTSGTDSPIEAINRLRKAENPTNLEDLRRKLDENAGRFSPKVVFPGEQVSSSNSVNIPPGTSSGPMKTASAPPPEPRVETRVVYKGHRYNGDFFSCMAVALVELNNPKVNEVMNAWAFVLKDLDGNQVFPQKTVSRPRSKKKKK